MERRFDESLMRYHDGEMSGRELEAFEARLAGDASLRVDLEALRRGDDALRGEFAFDGAPPLGVGSGSRGGAWRGYAVKAAVIAVLLGGAWFVSVTVQNWASVERDALPESIDASTIYAKFTRSFEPHVVCDTPEKFEAYTVEHLGARIGVSAEGGVALVGWNSYSAGYGLDDGLTRRVLLVESADGSRVVTVFQNDRAPAIDDDGMHGTNVFRRRVGDLDVIEISTLDAPVVLDLLVPMGG